jgi:hypothetical protein
MAFDLSGPQGNTLFTNDKSNSQPRQAEIIDEAWRSQPLTPQGQSNLDKNETAVENKIAALADTFYLTSLNSSPALGSPIKTAVISSPQAETRMAAEPRPQHPSLPNTPDSDMRSSGSVLGSANELAKPESSTMNPGTLVTREDVIACYKIFLRRIPENEEVITARIGVTRERILTAFMTSKNFLGQPENIQLIKKTFMEIQKRKNL